VPSGPCVPPKKRARPPGPGSRKGDTVTPAGRGGKNERQRARLGRRPTDSSRRKSVRRRRSM
jgi:hypothetical protein